MNAARSSAGTASITDDLIAPFAQAVGDQIDLLVFHEAQYAAIPGTLDIPSRVFRCDLA
jgi:hypothetical protein